MRHGALTFRLMVLTGHSCFARFLLKIRPKETPPHAQHTVEASQVRAEHRRVLVVAIDSADLSHSALIQTMIWSKSAWETITSFCEAVKEDAGCAR